MLCRFDTGLAGKKLAIIFAQGLYLSYQLSMARRWARKGNGFTHDLKKKRPDSRFTQRHRNG